MKNQTKDLNHCCQRKSAGVCNLETVVNTRYQVKDWLLPNIQSRKHMFTAKEMEVSVFFRRTSYIAPFSGTVS